MQLEQFLLALGKELLKLVLGLAGVYSVVSIWLFGADIALRKRIDNVTMQVALNELASLFRNASIDINT